MRGRFYRSMPRLRASGSSIMNSIAVSRLRRKAMDSMSSAQLTYSTIKDLFERHKVVFTVSTSIASVVTAWAGYSLRQLHQSRVEQKLESIEKAMKNNYQMEDPELRKLVSGSVSLPACLATAGTGLIIGGTAPIGNGEIIHIRLGLGWRGGVRYANRRFQREQMKLLGQLKPGRWPLKLFKRPILRRRLQENADKISEPIEKDALAQHSN
ncbi:uncharacterized protein LOC125210919 isoform X1 [Salvia hispanica]|uniref:uncharacterized protein LOC125210919 isoform X1 n=1 Tax=Salvia hispanica TaxID=49212 RepID=UPI002009B631|nr:uncharacterized protein LOC125210919 isoform X1 [Salvia hispanica]